mgnify:FL=1
MQQSRINQIYKQVVCTFGQNVQIIVAIEELSELSKELTKTIRNKMNPEGLAEEMADVEIMLEQLKLMFANEQNVKNWKTFKVQRLEKLIETVKKKHLSD